MQELSPKKQIQIVKLYLDGMSYQDIAQKASVSTGSVANVVAALKSGKYPDVVEVSDQVVMLKELANDLKKSGLTAAQALIGIGVLNSLHGLGLGPSDVQQCISLFAILGPADAESQQTFVRAALAYHDMMQKTGLDALGLEEKVKALEEKAKLLEPLAAKGIELKKDIGELQKKRDKLSHEVSSLEKQHDLLTENVAWKEQRDDKLSTRLCQLEEKLQSIEEKLAVARKDEKTLAAIGVPLTEFTGITERLKGIAQKHHIPPSSLFGRLLDELEHLDEEIVLEAAIAQKQQGLGQVKSEISQAEEKLFVLTSQNQHLQQEFSSIKAQIQNEREIVSQELKAIIEKTKDAAEELNQGQAKAIDDSLGEVNKLKDESMRIGIEFGKYMAIIKSNTFVEDMLSLMRGEDTIVEDRLRVLNIAMLKSTLVWLVSHRPDDMKYKVIKTELECLLMEMERWRPVPN